VVVVFLVTSPPVNPQVDHHYSAIKEVNNNNRAVQVQQAAVFSVQEELNKAAKHPQEEVYLEISPQVRLQELELEPQVVKHHQEEAYSVINPQEE